VAAAIGLAVYLIAYGPSFAFGTSAYWDLPLTDHRAYLMGYRYFLHEPWHWPLLVTHTMNVPYPKSIAFTDSLPAWAFANKLIATVIPPWRAFSARAYLGLWYGLCHVLQPCFGVAILRALGQRSWRATVIGAMFFIAIPTWAMRFVHASLFAHWLLLLALYLYVRIGGPGPAPRRLRLLSVAQLVLASLINPYHTAMSLGLYVASVLRSRRLASIALWIPVGFVAIGIALALAGYFARDAKVTMFGFDSASANALTWFVPHESGWFGERAWIDPTGFEYEGSAYLGLGVLGLLALLLPHARHVRETARRHPWLLAIAAGAGVFALSTRVCVGGWQLFALDIPQRLEWIASQFRCPGRFVWIPTYVLVTYLLVSGLRRFTTGWRAWALPVLAVVQIVDATGAWAIHRSHTRAPDREPIELAGWDRLVAAHEAVLVYPSYDCVLDGTPDMDTVSLEIEYLASEHPLPINGVYSARPTRDCALDDERAATMPVEPHTLYVMLPRMASHAARLVALGATCGQFAFGVACSADASAIGDALSTSLLKPVQLDAPALAYGAKLEPAAKTAERYLPHGWTWPDATGRWTDGPLGTILFHLEGAAPPSPHLAIQAMSIVCGKRTQNDVAVTLDGEVLGTLHFDGSANDPDQIRTLPISHAIADRPVHVLELAATDVRPLDKVRCNADPRRLGVFVRSIVLE
jgi:hypothetical protein